MPINNCQYTLLVITSSFRAPEKILKTLREADFMLLEASNQQVAIQRIRTTSPDLILLDIDKSVRQENTILQDFKTNKITGAIPVLFITSMTSENHIPECLNYDNIDFITNPFRPQELVIRVQHQLSLLRAERVIRRQNEKLKKSLEARDKLYSIIAHDLRAPIGTIKKINSSLLIRQKQGKFIGVKAPYGYVKDPADKNHLLIDERFAPTVRYIFQMAKDGVGMVQIARRLTAEKIPRPVVAAAEKFECYDR